MDPKIEAKLAVIDGMNFTLGKLTNVQVRLTLAGKDDLAKTMDVKRKSMLKQISNLQAQIADQWAVDAAELTELLRDANGKVQSRINDIRKEVNTAENAVQIIGQIDEALAFLKTVVRA